MSEVYERLKTAIADQYSLERKLGFGGMAVVYAARDLKHNRQVAIKVLRPELSAAIGAERFLLEIEIAARLTHPNILPLHDSGNADRLLYYVMPYIDGVSLRTRLDKERQLPIDEAIQITTEVASALDYAHRHDVIHRDIKPENILLHDGRALVADFGIARAALAAGDDRLTQTGLSLGTPRYMSPEQASGDVNIDKRSDIYSLAAVLYEMLAGDTPHTGTNSQAIIAKKLTEDPVPVSVHRPAVPPHIDYALQKGLTRIPADRFGSAAEFADAVAGKTVVTAEHVAYTGAHAIPRRSQWRTALPWAGLALVAGYGAFMTVNRPESSAARPTHRLTILLPDSAPVSQARTAEGLSPVIAFSPDGNELVYVADRVDNTMLYRRALNDFDAVPVPGTEGAASPFFSPDGQWIGFFADQELKKVSLRGGAPISLVPAPGVPGGGTWISDDEILFSVYIGTAARVPDVGGVVTQTESVLYRPSKFSGSDRFLVHAQSGRGKMGVYSLRADSTSWFDIDGAAPQFLPPDRLVFYSQGTISGIGLNLRTMGLVGNQIPLVVGVHAGIFQNGRFAISQNGDLAYLAGSTDDRREFVWVDREGRIDPLPIPTGSYSQEFSLSPDGRRVALTQSGASNQVLVYDVTGGPPVRVGRGTRPQWSPDGRWIAFNQLGGVFRRRSDGSGSVDTLITTRGRWVESWGPKDRLGIRRFPGDSSAGMNDVGILDPAGPNPTIDWVVATPSNEWGVELSPDGRHFAFVSDASGFEQVYVQRYPPQGPAIPIFPERAVAPRWTRDGRELISHDANGWYFAVPIETDGPLAVGEPRRLFRKVFEFVGGRRFDVAPDGRILALRRTVPVDHHRIQVIVNWRAEVDAIFARAAEAAR